MPPSGIGVDRVLLLHDVRPMFRTTPPANASFRTIMLPRDANPNEYRTDGQTPVSRGFTLFTVKYSTELNGTVNNREINAINLRPRDCARIVDSVGEERPSNVVKKGGERFRWRVYMYSN